MAAAPVVYRVVVPVSPERAARAFTDELGAWWPLETHSVHGAGGSVAVAGGVIVETSAAGERELWGSVMDQVPGRWFEATWHPGHPPALATRLSVAFEPVPLAGPGGVLEGTLVRLEHSGWECRDDAASARADYARDWPGVIQRYAVHCAALASQG